MLIGEVSFASVAFVGLGAYSAGVATTILDWPFAIGSFGAGVAGSLHAFTNNVISPGDFSFLLASYALAEVKVGGESSIAGPSPGPSSWSC